MLLCHSWAILSHRVTVERVVLSWPSGAMSRPSADVPLYQHLEAVVWGEVEFSQSRVGHGTGPLSLVQPRTDDVSSCHGRVVVCR